MNPSSWSEKMRSASSIKMIDITLASGPRPGSFDFNFFFFFFLSPFAALENMSARIFDTRLTWWDWVASSNSESTFFPFRLQEAFSSRTWHPSSFATAYTELVLPHPGGPDIMATLLAHLVRLLSSSEDTNSSPLLSSKSVIKIKEH